MSKDRPPPGRAPHGVFKPETTVWRASGRPTNAPPATAEPELKTSPDDLLDQLTHNLLESSLKRLTQTNTRRRHHKDGGDGEAGPGQGGCGDKANSNSAVDGTVIDNLGVYFSNCQEEGGSEEDLPCPLDTELERPNTRSASKSPDARQKDVRRRLESIEEVNEIESLRTGTDKRECNVGELGESAADRFAANTGSVSQEPSRSPRKRLQITSDPSYRSFEVNKSREAGHATRHRGAKHKTRKTGLKTEDNIPRADLSQCADHSALEEAWVSKSTDKTDRDDRSKVRYKYLRHFTFCENSSEPLHVGEVERQRPGSRHNIARRPFAPFEPLKRYQKGVKKEMERKVSYLRIKTNLGVMKAADQDHLWTSTSRQTASKDTSIFGPEKLSTTETKGIKRLVSFTTSDSTSSKVPISAAKRANLFPLRKEDELRVCPPRLYPNRPISYRTMPGAKETLLGGKVQLKHTPVPSFDHVMVSTEGSDDWTFFRAQQEAKAPRMCNIYSKSHLDNSLRNPGGPKSSIDQIIKSFRRQRLAKDCVGPARRPEKDLREKEEREGVFPHFVAAPKSVDRRKWS